METNRNFITPNGLKVRLDLSYFMAIICGEQKQYSTDEQLNNSILCNMVLVVEQRFCIPAVLKWFFTIAALILMPPKSIIPYCIGCTALYLFGMLWRVIHPDIILNFLINIMTVIYSFLNKVWFIPYITILIVGIIFKNIPILISFFVLSGVLSAISMLINIAVQNHTHRKYGIPFNDTELCAFRVFYTLLQEGGGMEKFIEKYCEFEEAIYHIL